VFKLFGNKNESKKVLKPLLKKYGIRLFLDWFAGQEKTDNFSEEEAQSYKKFLEDKLASNLKADVE